MNSKKDTQQYVIQFEKRISNVLFYALIASLCRAQVKDVGTVSRAPVEIIIKKFTSIKFGSKENTPAKIG